MKTNGQPIRKRAVSLLKIHAQVEALKVTVEQALAHAGVTIEPESTTPRAESDAKFSLSGVPANAFKQTPWFHVGRGVLRDGRDGPEMARNILKGAERIIVAHLLVNRSIGVADIVVHRAKNGAGNILVRKRHADAIICKIKAALGDIATIKKKGGRRSWVWIIELNDAIPIEFSIHRAVQLAELAQRELDANRPAEALALALQAVDEDDCSQLAHEVACRGALSIHTATQLDIARLRGSMRVLEERVARLGRTCPLLTRSLPYIEKDESRSELKRVELEFVEETRRLQAILEQMIVKFGDPHEIERPEDIYVNDMIKAFRTERLTYEQVHSDPRSRLILNHQRVDMLRNEMERLAQKDMLDDAGRAREMVNNIVLDKVLDIRIAASIWLVCDHASWEAKKSLCQSTWSSAEGRAAKKLVDAKDSFLAEHERCPNLEELAQELRWTLERVKEIVDWIKVNDPESLDSFDRQKPNRKPRSIDDDDDPDTGNLLTTGE